MSDGILHGTRGGWRVYFGLAVAGLALFWLARKAGWVGVGSSGLFWPVLVLGAGLTIAAGGIIHPGHRRCRGARWPGAGCRGPG